MIKFPSSTFKEVSTETLEWLIQDAKERIQSHPDHKDYVQDQLDLIDKCLAELVFRGVRS